MTNRQAIYHNDQSSGERRLRVPAGARFGPAKKWGNFPSFSAGWRISEESFMNDLDLLSSLLIRASIGFTGNEDIGDYRWIASMSKAQVAIGEDLTSSYYPNRIQNEDLAWERTRQINLGFDIGLFNNRISLIADLYKSNSDDLLLDVPVPAISGFNSVFSNIGAIETKGLELSLSSYNLTGDLKWNSNVTFSTYRSKIIKLGPDDAPMQFNKINMGIINEIGQTPFSFYGYQYDGVYMNQAEIDAHGVTYDFKVNGVSVTNPSHIFTTNGLFSLERHPL